MDPIKNRFVYNPSFRLSIFNLSAKEILEKHISGLVRIDDFNEEGLSNKDLDFYGLNVGKSRIIFMVIKEPKNEEESNSINIFFVSSEFSLSNLFKRLADILKDLRSKKIDFRIYSDMFGDYIELEDLDYFAQWRDLIR